MTTKLAARVLALAGGSLLSLLASKSLLFSAELGDHWRQRYAVGQYEWDWDHDGDGFTTRSEYFFGTNPRDATSRPPQLAPQREPSNMVLSWISRAGARYAIERSLTLSSWTSGGTELIGDGNLLEIETPVSGSAEFFRLCALTPLDGDGDMLSSVEEALLGTSTLLADTDSDGIPDGTEVFVTFTNPLIANPQGGTIRGQVKTDPNGDGSTADGVPLQNSQIYLDLNFDGEFTAGEPRLSTDVSGSYEFARLSPGVYHVRQILEAGQFQTLPAPGASPVFNGLPDQVAEYVHGTGGNLAVPYGALADTSAVVPYIIGFGDAVPVSPDIVLKPIGKRGLAPAFGFWSYTELLSIPQSGSILLRFDETLIDKTGPDLVIHKLLQGAGEQASLAVGYTADAMVPVTTLTEQIGSASTGIPIDFTTYGITTPVRYVKITALDNVGSLKGFELVGAEAVNYAPRAVDALEVTILATEVKENNDFARHFRDDPPSVFLFVQDSDFRAGQSASARVQASDDIALASLTLNANGAPVSLNSEGEGSIRLGAPGTIDLIATATDNTAQTARQQAIVYVNNADGSSPFSPNLTGAGSGQTFDIRVISPSSGSILATDVPITTTISGPTTPAWVLDYAPVSLINPYELAAADPDWITLGSGSSFLTNQSAGTFPAASLANGIYFLRLRATPVSGGLTTYFGQVLAKGVTASDIQPQVTLTSPAQHSTVQMTVPIVGSITSTRPLVEWFAEYAPAASVDLNNLGSSDPPWVRFAQGTSTISNAEIARFDATRVSDGSYIIRIVAWNDIRLGWAEPLPVEVTSGTFKPGRLRREFTDLSLQVGGIPFTIRRVYDSLESASDRGLGHGWSLAFFDPDIGETVATTGSGIFGATPFRDGTRVYLNSPSGKRVAFTFHPEAVLGSPLGTVYRATFTPDPGVYEKLETPEGSDPFLTIDSNGNAFIYFVGLAWNPSVYILTTPDGTRHTYDEDRGFVESKDLNGNTLKATADGIRHSSGAAVQFVRNGQNRITQINGPDGITIAYDYSPAGDLITVTDDDNRTTTFGYYTTPAHYLKDVTDPLGRVGTTYEYDIEGRLVAVIDEDDKRTEQDWDPAGFTGTITDRNGNVTSLVYNARGNVVQETNALNKVTTYAYTDPANPDKRTSRTDARSNTTNWVYDARGNVTQIRRPIWLFEDYAATYSPDGDKLTERTFDGQQSQFTHDAKRRMIRRQVAGESPVDYAYSPEGLLVQESSTAGGETVPASSITREYDGQGRQSRVTTHSGFSAQTSYDAAGRLTAATLPGNRTFSFTHDATGTPTGETDPSAHSTSTVLEPDGSWRFTNRLNHISRQLLAADGKPEKVTRPDGQFTTLGYDDERNLISAEDAAGNLHQWQYDALNRPIRYTDPTGAFSTQAYDEVGNIVEVINRNGKRRTFVFDSNNRMTHERWHDGSGTIIRDITFTWSSGSLVFVSDGGATWDIGTPMPRPWHVGVTYPGQVTREIGYGYQNNGLAGPGGTGDCCGGADPTADENTAPTSITVSGGTDYIRILAVYDGPHLQQLGWATPDDFLDGPVVHFLRDASDQVTEIRRYRGSSPLKSRTTLTWDSVGRLIGQSHLDSIGNSLHANAPVTYARDAESRITGITRAGDVTTNSHDILDQLTTVAHTAGASESYTYDLMGVRTASHLVPGAGTVGAANRLLTSGIYAFTYDAEGNVAEKTNTSTGQVTRFAYDHRNQLIQGTVHASAVAPASTTVLFEYDYEGRMISRSLNGAKTWILYDRQMPVAEFADGANSVNAAFLYAPNRLDDFLGVWRAGTGVRMFLKDNVGTVIGATDQDGVLSWWTSYDAFGNLRGAAPGNNESIRFTGRFYNEALGLYEMRARFYDPLLGRFTQEDPLGLRGGDMNLYRYAFNNPLNFTDPTGSTSALEYAALLYGITETAHGAYGFSQCLNGILSYVNNSLAAGRPTGSSGVDCLGGSLNNTGNIPVPLFVTAGKTVKGWVSYGIGYWTGSGPP